MVQDLFSAVDSWGEDTIVVGGSSLIENLIDMFGANAGDMTVRACAKDPIKAAFEGAQSLTSIDSFESSWVTVEEYREHGDQIVHHKCSATAAMGNN